MKVVIQRVTKASVIIEGKTKTTINSGLLVLLGIEHDDNLNDIKWLSSKIANLRIFSDQSGLMNLSVKDINGDILVISQFTLLASTKKGNRPSYIKAARPEIAIPLYETFLSAMKEEINREIFSGIFGADMKVDLINDGPVTICMDSKNKE